MIIYFLDHREVGSAVGTGVGGITTSHSHSLPEKSDYDLIRFHITGRGGQLQCLLIPKLQELVATRPFLIKADVAQGQD